MLDEILGLPAHPLIIHATVVFVPLLVAAAAAYAVLARFRRQLGWVVVALAVAAPVVAYAAKESGERFLARRIGAAEPPPLLATHQAYGTVVTWTTIALGLATLSLVLLVRWQARDEGEPPSGPIPAIALIAAILVDLVLAGHVVLLFFGLRLLGPIILGLAAAVCAITLFAGRTGRIAPGPATAVLIGAVLVLAAGAGGHVLLTGHSGATSVWSS